MQLVLIITNRTNWRKDFDWSLFTNLAWKTMATHHQLCLCYQHFFFYCNFWGCHWSKLKLKILDINGSFMVKYWSLLSERIAGWHFLDTVPYRFCFCDANLLCVFFNLLVIGVFMVCFKWQFVRIWFVVPKTRSYEWKDLLECQPRFLTSQQGSPLVVKVTFIPISLFSPFSILIYFFWWDLHIS